ncbi:MAG TPA: YfhO family protein [Polyangiaceae bacterium]|jgi:hypothetical protein|nr:YfhO family protein [Polyangiaceae bacterium]
MRRKPAALLPALFFLGLLAAYFLVFIRAELVDLGRPSLWSSFDLESYFLPRFWFGAHSLLHGELPLWNPYEFGGLPFLATGQPSVFYPPTILFFGLLPRVTAHWTYLVFHYVLAAWAMFYFLRTEKLNHVAAFVGVAMWIFSVPVLSSNYHPPRIGHMAWVPWVFAFAERAGLGNRRAFVALALVVTLQITCGYPEFAMDEAVLLTVHALVCWRSGRWTEPPWKTLPKIGAAFILGVLGAAVQLVPLGELGRLSNREHMAPTGTFAFPAEVGTGALVHMVPGLIGFMLVGLFARRSLPAAIGFFFALLIGNGGWKILRLVPGFSFIRFPLVWVYLVTFYFAWLAALGADGIVAPAENSRASRRRVIGLVASAALFAAFYVVGWSWATHGAPSALTKGLSLSVQNGSAAMAGVVGVSSLAALALLARRMTIPAAAWMAAASLTVFAQFFAFPFGARPSLFRPPTETGRAARFEADNHPLTGRALSPDDVLYGYEVTDRVPSPLGVEQSFLPSRHRNVVAELGYISLFGRIDWDAVRRAKGYLDAMNVELVVAPPAAVEQLRSRGFVEAARSETDSFMVNPMRMGSAWVNYAVRKVPTARKALEYTVGAHFDPHREVVLEEPTKLDYPSPSAETPRATPPLAMHRTSSTKATWDVELSRPGIFVASESAYPGWEATVDGHATPWMTADYVLRGVELDQGRHQVTFEYRPASFRLGLLLTCVGLAGICLVAMWRRSASNA